MKTFGKVLAASAIAATLASCGGIPINTNVKLNNTVDSSSYAFGTLMGQQAQQTFKGMNDEYGLQMEFESFIAGFKAAFDNDTVNIKFKSPMEANMYLSGVVNQLQIKKSAESLEKNRKFLDENAKKQGVISLPNGLQYQVITEGNGAKPELTDTVVCKYEGRLIDGTVFDASAKHPGDGTAKFPLNGVIKGWQELISMMPLGSKWQLVITPELGYGQQAMGNIPANSILIFDVELLEIKKGPAAK